MSLLTTSTIQITNVDDGQTGQSGLGIASEKRQYYLSTSNSSLIGGSWSDTEPTEIPTGKFMWARWEFTMEDGSLQYSNAVYESMISGVINKTNEIDGKITQKIWQSDVDTAISEYDENTVQGISDRVTQTESDISGITSTVSTVQSTLETKADSSTVATLQNTVTQNKQTTDAFEQTVTTSYAKLVDVDSKIDDIEIGGNNLYVIKTQTDGFINAGGSISEQTSANEYTSDYIPILAGENYVLQSWATPVTQGGSWLCYQLYADTQGATVGARISKDGSDPTSGMDIDSQGREHLQYNILVPSGAYYMRVSYKSYDDGMCMLEKATKASDYSVSSEDMEYYTDNVVLQAKTEIKQTTDAIELSVASKVGANEIISKINQSAESINISAQRVDLQGNITFNMFDRATQDVIASGSELIIGTQQQATSAWTGESIRLGSLSTGTRISFKLPYASTNTPVTLNLTLTDDTVTGAIPVYYLDTTPVTTQYGINSIIDLIYDGSVWRVSNPYSTANTYDRIRYQQPIYAGENVITANNLIVADVGSGTYHNLNSGEAFDMSYPILYAVDAIPANGAGDNNYLVIPESIVETQSGTYEPYKSVYIKGTLSGTTFTPASTTPLTQVVPTSMDNYHYILLGNTYNASEIYLLEDHPVYMYYNGGFKTTTQIATEAATSANTANQTLSNVHVSNIETTYGISSSPSIQPVTWNTTVPQWIDGQYIWQKTVTTALSGSTVTDIVCLTGQRGMTGASGDDAYTVLLTNESHTFAGGTTSAKVGMAECYVIAYKGSTQIAATIGTITGQPTGMTTTISNNNSTNAKFTVTVTTAMTDLAGVLTIPITVDGNSFTKSFAYSVALTGQDGAPGTPGEPSTIHMLNVSSSSVVLTHDGYYNPSSITVSAKSKTGSQPLTDYAGRFMIDITEDNTTWTNRYTSVEDESSASYTIASVGGGDIKRIRCRLYLAGSTQTLLDEQILPIVNDGVGVSSIEPYYYLGTIATPTTTPLTDTDNWSTTPQTYINNRVYWTCDVITYDDGTQAVTTIVEHKGLNTALANANSAMSVATVARETAAKSLGMKINFSDYTTSDPGECYIHGYTNDNPDDVDGYVYWNGIRRTVQKMAFNPNTIVPYYTTVYIVLRLQSSSATTGDLYMVWYSYGSAAWQSAVPPTPNEVSTWTWAESTDVVLGQFIEPSSEGQLVDAYLYEPPRNASHVISTGYNPYTYSADAVGWVNNNGTNMTDALSMIMHWTQNAISDTTRIQGGWIATNTITSEQLATNAIVSANYVAASNTSSPYSATGTFLDLSNGNFWTPNFGVINQTPTGTTVPTGAWFNGTVYGTSGRFGRFDINNPSANDSYWEIRPVYDMSSRIHAALVGVGSPYLQTGNWQMSDNAVSTRKYTANAQAVGNVEYYKNTDTNTFYDVGMKIPTVFSKTTDSTAERFQRAFYYMRKYTGNIAPPDSEAGDASWQYPLIIDSEGRIYCTDIIILDGGTGTTYLPLSGGTITGNLTVQGTLTATVSHAGQVSHSITINGQSFNGSEDIIVSTLGISYGGTGKSSWTANRIVYAPNASSLAQLGAGASGQVLSSNGNDAPGWVNQSTLSVGSANTWTTGRTLTIGGTGKSVDGSANVSWSKAEISGVAVAASEETGVTGNAGWMSGADKAKLDSIRVDSSGHIETYGVVAGTGISVTVNQSNQYIVSLGVDPLLKTGGTLTGAVNGTSFSASDYISVNSGSSGTTGGLALYGTTPLDNGIAMRATTALGKHGFVQGDLAIYNTISSGTTKGWIWRYNSTNNVASISAQGHAVFSGSVTVGGNETNNSGCKIEYNSQTKSISFNFY